MTLFFNIKFCLQKGLCPRDRRVGYSFWVAYETFCAWDWCFDTLVRPFSPHGWLLFNHKESLWFVWSQGGWFSLVDLMWECFFQIFKVLCSSFGLNGWAWCHTKFVDWWGIGEGESFFIVTHKGCGSFE